MPVQVLFLAGVVGHYLLRGMALFNESEGLLSGEIHMMNSAGVPGDQQGEELALGGPSYITASATQLHRCRRDYVVRGPRVVTSIWSVCVVGLGMTTPMAAPPP